MNAFLFLGKSNVDFFIMLAISQHIFRVSHILSTRLKAREIKAKYEKQRKHWPYCAR